MYQYCHHITSVIVYICEMIYLLQATFAEIPGVLETGTIRKIDRRYPFNDACQVSL